MTCSKNGNTDVLKSETKKRKNEKDHIQHCGGRHAYGIVSGYNNDNSGRSIACGFIGKEFKS